MISPRVVVVGSYVQDLVFRCENFPRPGETTVGRFATGPGGKGSNQAVAAARAGGRVAFIGAVGNDAFGAGAAEFHRAEGIESLLAVKTAQPTGTAGIIVNASGQNEIIVALNANDALSPADIDAHAGVLGGAAVLVAQLEANLEAAAHAMRLAHGAGAAVILNPAPMRPDFDLAPLAAAVDILIPNETEFCALARLDEDRLAALADADLHAACRRFGIETVIVTLGARGCFLSRPDARVSFPAMPGVQPVDTTGAGDAFVGAFAAALAELGTREIERAIRFATAGAALSITRPGAALAMPHRVEIDALLNR